MKRIIQKYHQHRVEVDKVVRFLITGVWNTLFGVLVYIVLYEGLKQWVNYLVLAVPANILAITNAYICYKLFVFKTRGNIVREYLRFYVVYGGAMLMGMALMFGMVSGLGLNPVISQILCVPISLIFSYCSHRNYSFRKAKVGADNEGDSGKSSPEGEKEDE
ncbi:MAG: GtrA family protein [Victivallaceae bacterium]|jgi:putative flippase GtrA